LGFLKEDGERERMRGEDEGRRTLSSCLGLRRVGEESLPLLSVVALSCRLERLLLVDALLIGRGLLIR
jgi:hypothetical protein